MRERRIPIRIAGWLAKRLLSGAIVVMATAAIGACGEASRQRAVVGLAIQDRSTSFATFVHDCVPDFLTFARALAERQGHFYAGTFLSRDPFSARFEVERHFDEAPPAIAGNKRLEDGYQQRQAQQLKPELDRLADTPPIDGSPAMRALERASNFKEQRAPNNTPFWLVVCSDLANMGGGLDVRRPISDQQVAAAVEYWSPRLDGLRGADLYFIGAGRRAPGTHSRPDSIQQVQRALRLIAPRVGARVRLIDTQLGQIFPNPGVAE